MGQLPHSVTWVVSEQLVKQAGTITPEDREAVNQAFDRSLRGLHLRMELAMYGPNLPTTAQAYEMLVRHGFIEPKP